MASDEYFPTASEIDELNELMEVAMILEEHEIPYPGLTTVEEMKDRLRLELRRRQGNRPKELIAKGLLEGSEENKKKRQRLMQVFSELLNILQHTDGEGTGLSSSMVDEFLSVEGTTDNIKQDCQAKIGDLKKGDCVLLIAGETSAGKSSLLNLLLDTPGLLPTAVISCTSAITSVRYGDTKYVRIIFNDPGKADQVIDPLDDKGMAELHSVAFMKGNERETGHDVKEVQVYLPIWFLKTGLVLADTPGIGENDFLEDYLHQYIANNEILGFIYVIMSDAAGGVKEDRLLMLLRLIMEEQKKNKKGLPFDPRASLFVCNRFDAIPVADQDKVKNHILEQLGKHWPEFDANMAVFFSTHCARRDVEAHEDYINDQYKTLLQSISTLYTIAADRRVKASYKWLEKVMWRITHIVKSIYKRLDMSARDNEEQSKKIQAKLNKLNQDTATVIKELRAEVDIEIAKFSSELRKYLVTAQAKFRLCSVWNEDEIPQLSEKARSQEHWNWVKERVDSAFYNRLCSFLEEWDTEGGKVEDIEEKLIVDVQSKLGILETEILDIETGMASSASSSGQRSTRGFSRRLSLGASKLVGPRSPLSSELITPKLSLGARATTSNPLLKTLRSPKSRNLFNKNPEAWAKVRAEKLLKKLVEKKKTTKEGRGILETLITHLMQQPIEYIDKIEQKIPSLVEANFTLLKRLHNLNMQGRGGLNKYGSVMEDIEGLRKRLMEYGEGYIFVNDFKTNEIRVLHEIQNGGSLSKTFTPNVRDLIESASSTSNRVMASTIGGLWTVLVPGMLTKDNQEKSITIKIYLPSSGVSDTFQEIAKLRCLLYKDIPIAEFLGTHHANATLPAFVFDEELISLQTYMQSLPSGTTNISQTVIELAQGVAYIHSKGLVHMELTSTTVTVNRHGEVRLTGTCFPRRATLPLDRDNPVSNFVHLAPEVLQGDLYITSADMYGFGLLVFELTGAETAFKKERRFSFQNFIEKVNPVTMLPLDMSSKQWLSDGVYKVIAQCVSLDVTLRPKMTNVIDMLQECKTDIHRRSSAKTASPAELFRRSSRATSERSGH